MCKETLPEIPFGSNLMCTFRPKTSFAPTPPNHYHHLQSEQDLEPVDSPKLKRQNSNGKISHEIPSSNMNYLIDETVRLDQPCQAPVRPKTVRVTCSERTSCNPGLLTMSLQNEQNQRTPLKEHRKKEVVVFLPTSGNSTNPQTSKTVLQGLSSHLPEIGSETRTLSRPGEVSESHRCKTPFEHDVLSPLPHRLSQLKNIRHSIGLPVISSPRPDRKPLRRAKSDNLENHLKQAEREYDKYEAKAFLVYNWMKAQNGQAETSD